MTICKVTGMACDCQPDEGVECTGEQTLREGFHGWRNAALKAEARVRELEALPAAPVEAVVPSDERQAFEAWAHSIGFNIHRDESDKYKDYHRATTRFARDGWLLALAWRSQFSPPAVLVEPTPRTDGAPPEIWLQLHGDGEPDGKPVDYTGGVSWCWHKVHEHDVRYVLAAPAALPAGFKLVPVQATEPMLVAASTVRHDAYMLGRPLETSRIWAAMLAAAPAAPLEQKPEEQTPIDKLRGALADIAFSTDMNLRTARAKAERIYKETE